MVKRVEFIVKMPTEDGTYETFRYNTPQEVCDILDISKSTMYAISKNQFQCTKANQQYLKGVTIERKPIGAREKPKQMTTTETKDKKKEMLERMRKSGDGDN